jgi:hypothetical protein
MSMTRAQIATQLLNEMAPKGEKLAYINNREAELLKRMGGAGKNINETGIKSYYYDEVGQTMGGTGFQDTSSLTGAAVMVEVAVMIIFHSQLWLKKWTQLQKEEVEL